MVWTGATEPIQEFPVVLDGKETRAQKGETILTVARRNHVPIPTLCHKDGVPAYGSCRLCTVKVKKGEWSKFVTACNYPVWDGVEIETSTEEVLQIRRLVVEALLSRCPEVETLRRLARTLNLDPAKTRFPNENPKERCILCGLCVRVCREVVGANALGFVERGTKRRVATAFLQHPDACIGCGACTWVCPTDCISMEERALETLRGRWGERRPCRYALMGLLPGATCPNDYRCNTCETEQTISDLCAPIHPVFVAANVDTPQVRTLVRRLSRLLNTKAANRLPAKEESSS